MTQSSTGHKSRNYKRKKVTVLPPEKLESSHRAATALSYQAVSAVSRTGRELRAEFPALVSFSTRLS